MQWGGRIWSVVTRAWDENLGGMWEYDHNSFILQSVDGPQWYAHCQNRCPGHRPDFLLGCKLHSPWKVSRTLLNRLPTSRLIHATDGDGLFCSLTPRSFSIIFITADFFCLVIQGAGGGIAGTANTSQGSDNGAKIITAGVILQRECALSNVAKL